MKRFIYILAIIVLCLTGCSENEELKTQFEKYNIEWDQQSVSSQESMPLSGGNGFGANVWVKDGIIYSYLASNNSYDENGNLLKLGAITVELNPNPFVDTDSFSQKLDLYNGRILLHAESKDGLSADVALWYDDVYNGLHIETEASSPVQVLPSFATWRVKDEEVNLASWNHRGVSYQTKADMVEPTDHSILFYHKNVGADAITDRMLAFQKMTSYKEDLVNPAENLIFGGMVYGDSLKYVGTDSVSIDRWTGVQWKLASKATVNHRLLIVSCVKQESDLTAWKVALAQNTESALRKSDKLDTKSHSFWNKFWEKSYVLVNMDAPESDPGFQIGRNYQLFRYMLASNRGNNIPLRFNGGIFTFSPMQDDEIKNKPNDYKVNNVSPDYRSWGNLFMSQNQRLIGWPALSSGDFDLVEPSLLFYLDRLSIAEDRSKQYWNHGGASFMESLSLYGLPVDKLATPTGEASATHLRHQFSMQIEFAYMALLWSKYSGKDVSKYMPFVESVIEFYDEHYRAERRKSGLPEYDEEGHLVLYPMNALEIYSDATNPVEGVAGLKVLLQELLTLPDRKLSRKTKKQYQELYDRLPEMPLEMRNGKQVLSPAKVYGKQWNPWEFPEMYAVWPYSLGRKGKSFYEEALNTWQDIPESRREYAYKFWSWQCTPIYAAMLGDTENARQLMVEKLSDKNSNVKFPAFFGPGHDWIPDFNWGGAGMVGLQKMLFDSDQDAIYLFTSWPEEWSVNFKLHGYDRTVVEGKYDGRKLDFLKIKNQAGKKVWNGLVDK